MIVLSTQYPGITIQCPNCSALLAIDPHKDIYENKYVYCPICREKLDAGIREGSWRPAIWASKEAFDK